MTSVQSQYSQVPSNKLYVNINNAASSILTSSLTNATWVTNAGALGQLSTAGAAILRDMGKTLYVPSPSIVAVGAVPGISTVLRKVQLVPTGTTGTYGVGGAYAGTETDYFTGYIQLGALQQGGGGNGAPVSFVRLN
jgi:hypothetical protein